MKKLGNSIDTCSFRHRNAIKFTRGESGRDWDFEVRQKQNIRKISLHSKVPERTLHRYALEHSLDGKQMNLKRISRIMTSVTQMRPKPRIPDIVVEGLITGRHVATRMESNGDRPFQLETGRMLRMLLYVWVNVLRQGLGWEWTETPL